jgi:hypothetical protein
MDDMDLLVTIYMLRTLALMSLSLILAHTPLIHSRPHVTLACCELYSVLIHDFRIFTIIFIGSAGIVCDDISYGWLRWYSL